jgi:type I restriction enzyme R subunit
MNYEQPGALPNLGFREEAVELAALAWFEALGWRTLEGSYLAPDGPGAPRGGYRDVVLLSRLEDAIARLNPDLGAEGQNQVVRAVLNVESQDLLEQNRRLMRLLRDGVDVEVQDPRHGHRTRKARLVDFDAPENNDFLATSQFVVVEGREHRRLDIVAFVNGLPLAVLELKDATNPNVTLRHAFNQIKTYKDALPSLFRFNTATIVSDGMEARIGSFAADFDRFAPWRTVDGQSVVERGVAELETLIRGVFDRSRFLDFAIWFSAYRVENGVARDKKLAGYHQYHAVNKALAATVNAASAGGSHKAGVIWHTQGSGKSLTMAFYVSKLEKHPALKNPTVVVVTDRNDLDEQLFGTFVAHPDLFQVVPEKAESREDLRARLNRASGGIIFTTMQKFAPNGVLRNDVVSDRANVIVIADEAHRTQYGLGAQVDRKTGQINYGLATHLRDTLPNATFIGFTGTPIELSDRNTYQVFGDVIDTYDIAQAVDDGATVPIYYTARLVQLHFDQELREVIDEGSDEILEGEEETEREKQKSKWSRLVAVAGAPDRVKTIAADIVSHFEERRDAMGGGKGMIVAMSRRIAVALYDEIARLRPGWVDADDAKGIVKVVMTGSASDPIEFRPHVRRKSENEKLANRFKDPDDPFSLVIVRDMWLTGFDAPCLHTLYVDKPMHGHGLMQAIARVNRVFGQKPGGLVVDYLGLGAELKQALAAYSQSDRERTAIDQEAAVRLLLAKHEAASDFLSSVQWRAFFGATPGQRLNILKQTVEAVLGQPDGRKRYLDLAVELSRAFALAAGTPEANRLREEVAFMLAVRANLLKYTGNGRRDRHDIELELSQLLSRAVIADGLLDVFQRAGFQQPDIAVLSDEFLEEVRGMQQRNLAIETLRRLLNGQVKSREKQNIVEARRFSERLEEAIARYHNRAIDSVQVIQELIELAKEMRASMKRGEELGLSDDEIAFYDALAENKSAVDVLGIQGLRELAQEIVHRIRPLVTVDWSVKENVRAKLRVEVRRLLRQYGYPPDLQQMAVDLVVEQATVVCDRWSS